MIKILILNPVSTTIWNDLVYEYIKKIVEPTTQIVIRNIGDAPPAIECEYDKTLAEHLVVGEVINANREGFNAVVINCFDDPGLHSSRETSDIPVFGIGETSLYYALVLGDNIAIISTGKYSMVAYRRKARELGIEDRVVYISGIEVPVLELRSNEKLIKEMLMNEIRRAVESWGAEVVVLGCGGFIGISEELSRECGIPIVDPTLVTVKMAESTVKLGYVHSKRFLLNRLKTPYH
jgi:allantoin racemase